MSLETGLPAARRISAIARVAGLCLLIGAVVTLSLVCLWPVKAQTDPSRLGKQHKIEAWPELAEPPDQMLSKMTGKELIRPAQAQAAVKDSGAAKALAKRLKLQGIVQIGDAFTAYVQVEKDGVKSVRKGDTILEFAVKKVEAGKVTLSLDNVEVELSQ
jgi:hypothetical protein